GRVQVLAGGPARHGDSPASGGPGAAAARGAGPAANGSERTGAGGARLARQVLHTGRRRIVAGRPAQWDANHAQPAAAALAAMEPRPDVRIGAGPADHGVGAAQTAPVGVTVVSCRVG